MTPSRHQILITGLGQAGLTHLKVLEQAPGAEVVACVDTAPRPGLTFRGHPVPVYQAPHDAARRHQPDIAVIATPTHTHAAVCGQIADCFPAARILVEKPAADALPGARHVLEDIASRQPVDIAYHMSFSPEVTWGRQVTREHASDLGDPVAAQAFFADAYQETYETARARLGSSWIDSGINALSVLTGFADPVSRSSLRPISEPQRSVFEAHVTFHAAGTQLDALILTSWHVTDPAKTTRIRFSSGAELVMDHTAVVGYLIRGGQIAAVYGSDRAIPRRERHYLALYKHWLTGEQPIMPAATSLRLHELLLTPGDNA
jgi:predicted dehydrogenase